MTQNKCICFCLQLAKLKHLSHEEFEHLNWLPMNSVVFKYFNEQGPNYLNKVFDVTTGSNFQLSSSFQKLKCPFRKTNNSQNALSYIGPTFWNQTPHTLKHSNNLNTFKQNFKKYYLKELKNSNNSFSKHVLCHPTNSKSFFLCLRATMSYLIVVCMQSFQRK